MNSSAKNLINILQKNGFEFRRAKGSHQIYYNKDSNKTITVPLHSNKDLPKGTFFAIIKQAGIDKSKV